MIVLKACKKADQRLVVELEKDGKQVLAVLNPQTVGAPFINDPAGPHELVKVIVAALNELDVPTEHAEPVVIADPFPEEAAVKAVAEPLVTTKRSGKGAHK